MPPLEAWEGILVDKAFTTSTHGKLGCIACHGGVSGATDKTAAHKGVIANPDAQKTCSTCHSEIVKNSATSLHATQNGYMTTLTARGADMTKLQEPFNNHCASCHASCGDCHVSRPSFTGGGLLAGHTFKKVASQSDTCMACHSTRVGDEYMGKLSGAEGDVHWTKQGMPCVTCHKADVMHGTGTAPATMYAGKAQPACLDCHKAVAPGAGKVVQHELHGQKLACEVCHSSGNYKNCINCHVGKDAKGLPYRMLDPSWLTFKIGKNPIKSADRPWDYVLVRHVPANADIFDAYVKNALPKVDALPTWKYATPHNMVRNAPQTASCNNCHGNTDLFLTAKDVKPEEAKANASVIVATVPAKK